MTNDLLPEPLLLNRSIEIGAGWTKKGETSHKEYVSLALAAAESGLRKLYANLGRAGGQGYDRMHPFIYSPSE